MKWTDKAHQFDAYRSEYDRMTSNGDGICLFGTGKISKEISYLLRNYDFISYYIDNDKKKQQVLFQGRSVISIEDHIKREDRLIVIATNKKNEREIKAQLKSYGLEEKKDYVSEDYFINNLLSPMLFLYKNKIFVDLTQISVTEKCSLKCKKCAHACFAVQPGNKDMLLDEVKASADQFFRFVDRVRYFVLIGGEPLLYKDLYKAIRYIGENYGDRICRIQITTNGTIIPQKALIEACKEYGVYFMISNYSRAVPRIKEKLVELTTVLKNESISYELFPEETEWMDYGFDHINRSADENELIQVFDNCRTGCHEIRNERYYYCVMARSVSENLMNGEVGHNDYLDLSKLDSGSNEDREIFVEYLMGYSDKGYLDMCNYCNGSEAFKFTIPAAEQL